MLSYLFQLIVFAVSVLITARIVPGIKVKSFGSAVLFAFVVGILNVLLFKVLVFFTLPFVLVTFGLFLLVINGFLWWIADKIVGGVELESFGAAIVGAFLTAIINVLFMWVLPHF